MRAGFSSKSTRPCSFRDAPGKLSAVSGKPNAMVIGKFDTREYASLVSRAERAKTAHQKGQKLEDLVEYLLGAVPGLEIRARDFRGPSEEIDLVVWNQTRTTVFSSWDAMVFVECKNWSSPVGVPEIVVFIDRLRRVGLRNGVLVARNGVTGSARVDARLLLREALRDGIRIIVITLDELSAIRNLHEFLDLCKEKYCKVFLSQL